jgi:hypothetical protein
MEIVTHVIFPMICAVIVAYVIHVIIKDWRI